MPIHIALVLHADETDAIRKLDNTQLSEALLRASITRPVGHTYPPGEAPRPVIPRLTLAGQPYLAAIRMR